jgi:hypothetical protein
MTIATQVFGTTLLTLALTGAAFWANGIIPAPRIAACLDNKVEAPAPARVSPPVETAPSCGGDSAVVESASATNTRKETP